MPSAGFAPAEITVPAHSSFAVEIPIDDVEALYGAEVQVVFDPAQVEVEDADPDWPGIQIELGPLFDPENRSIALNRVDNEVGRIDIALTLLNPAPPINGGGILARIPFRCLEEGASELAFASITLSDRDGYAIDVEPQSGSITQIANEGVIRGRVLLQGRNAAPSGHSGATVEVDGVQDTTDADGNYELSLSLGIYTVEASMPGYLRSEKTEVIVAPGETVTLPDVELDGGDANGDCLINIIDLATIAQALGTSDPGADINADGEVNIQDLSIIGGNFHKECPSPPWEMSLNLKSSALASLQSPQLLVLPASSNVSGEEKVTVEVRIEEVMDLYAAEVQLQFDPAVLQVQSIANGDLLPGCFPARSFDNRTGAISYGCTLTGAGSGVIGSGVLAHITFQGVGAGTSDVTFSPHAGPKALLLLDHSLDEIPVEGGNTSKTSITVLAQRKVYLPVIGRR